MAMTENVCEAVRRSPVQGPIEFKAALARGRHKEPGGINPNELSIRDLAEGLVVDRNGALCGREYIRACDPKSGMNIQEAGDGVDVTAFSNITGQLVFSSILQAHMDEQFIFTQLISTTPTRLDGEKIPGIEQLGDGGEDIEPGMPYERKGFGEDYIETPATKKRGLIVPVTKEAIFFDKTGLILMRAQAVGHTLGYGKEKRIIDAFIGGNDLYKYKLQGTSYYPFILTASGAPTDFKAINQVAANELVGWDNIEEMELLFANMTEFTTGEPIAVTPTTLFVMPAKLHTARQVLGAFQINIDSDTMRTMNTLNSYNIVSSAQLNARVVLGGNNTSTVSAANAKNYMYLGDPARYMTYMENWPITFAQAPPNSAEEFDRDIVAQFKASERGNPAILDPRYMTKSYATI